MASINFSYIQETKPTSTSTAMTMAPKHTNCSLASGEWYIRASSSSSSPSLCVSNSDLLMDRNKTLLRAGPRPETVQSISNPRPHIRHSKVTVPAKNRLLNYNVNRGPINLTTTPNAGSSNKIIEEVMAMESKQQHQQQQQAERYKRSGEQILTHTFNHNTNTNTNTNTNGNKIEYNQNGRPEFIYIPKRNPDNYDGDDDEWSVSTLGRSRSAYPLQSHVAIMKGSF